MWSVLLCLCLASFGLTMGTTNVTSAVKKDKSNTVSVIKLRDGSFEVIPGQQLFSQVVVWAKLLNKQTKTGWMHLEITSNEKFPDSDQALAAGIAEGYLTRNTLTEYYKEFFTNDLCDDNGDHKGFCDWMEKKLDINQDWVNTMVIQHGDNDPYWHMVRLFYLQLDGMEQGMRMKTTEQEDEIESIDSKYIIRLANFVADIWDYVEIFHKEEADDLKVKSSRPTCSVLIKHLKDQDELFVGHNAWHEYRAMGYRFVKKYNLNYHVLPGRDERVPGHTASMSSYAGAIFSLDDFVTLSSGLVTTETSLFIYNTSIYEDLDPSSQLFEPVRVMIANRLAKGGEQWTQIFMKHNSGTYNNQWMVIDYNKIGNQGQLEDGTFWVLEQLPGMTWAQDQTEHLRNKGYWGSYNRAYYKQAFKLSGANEMVEKHGDWFSYDKTPRALIMARDQDKINNETSMMKFMRYNDFQSDSFAKVDGCPKPIPAGSIANRCDLTLPNSECSWESLDYMVGHQPYGALDMKFVSRRLLQGQQFWAVAGPTHSETMPPFSWRSTNLTKESIPHYTPIEVFNFYPAVTKWTMVNINEAKLQI